MADRAVLLLTIAAVPEMRFPAVPASRRWRQKACCRSASRVEGTLLLENRYLTVNGRTVGFFDLASDTVTGCRARLCLIAVSREKYPRSLKARPSFRPSQLAPNQDLRGTTAFPLGWGRR